MAGLAAFACDFKNHPQDFIPDALIREAAAGYVWRRRVLGPVLTVHLMVLQCGAPTSRASGCGGSRGWWSVA